MATCMTFGKQLLKASNRKQCFKQYKKQGEICKIENCEVKKKQEEKKRTGKIFEFLDCECDVARLPRSRL
jgi:hypothetical protein